MADRVAVDTGDLWRWVDRLTRARRERVVRKTPGARARIEYFELPSLWTQLIREVDSSSTGGGHGAGGTGSRPPINLEKVALAAEISDLVTDALIEHGERPRLEVDATTDRRRAATPPALVDDTGRPLHDPDVAGRLVERAARAAADQAARRDSGRLQHDTASDLRHLAAVVADTREVELITWWADQYRYWVARVETALGSDDESIDTRPVRGKACPACEATYAIREQPSEAFASGVETFHDPALVVQFHDGRVRHVTCRACGGDWWRGEGLEQLGEQLGGSTAWTTSTGDEPAED
ncbi:hypothetical protein [Blastococcus sp. CCUG 61487]|uniref:DUF7341 domain-containing protein n=1 Tax=Blastococcus sp. CCUG 61487 TaxID=1840703 RepID=UPI0010C14576|nr:hypothetical protein [Blastococcus sp. CCUG 61487]TKJ24354.1 hypothetical protein A6V29_04980 [Blastococcus sp. CCUG 61487]